MSTTTLQPSACAATPDNEPVHAHAHLRLPPEAFYWALLDTTLLELRHRRDPRRLGFLFEPLLPVPLEQVHLVFHRIDATHVIGCAIDRSVLEEESPPEAPPEAPPEIPDTALTLCPSKPPDHLSEHAEYIHQLNLLTGRYTPTLIVRLRRSLLIRTAAACLLVSFVLLIGLERRAALHHAHAANVHTQINGLYDAVLGPTDKLSGQPRELQLLAERRRLEQTRRDVDLPMSDLRDISAELESLLVRWPNQHHLLTETITITPTAITVRAALPTDEVPSVLSAFEAWENWQRRQPEVSNQRGAATITVRFTRTADGGGS